MERYREDVAKYGLLLYRREYYKKHKEETSRLKSTGEPDQHEANNRLESMSNADSSLPFARALATGKYILVSRGELREMVLDILKDPDLRKSLLQ